MTKREASEAAQTAMRERGVSYSELAQTPGPVIGRGLRDRCVVPGAPPQAAGTDDPLQLLFLGRLEHRKRVDILLDAVTELVADGVSLVLTLAGPDPDGEIPAAFARRSAQDERLLASVRLVGAVSDAERDRLLRCTDIVCCPSRYESHGVVLLEAMMFGRPIVTCDAGGIGEVVVPGESALICPPEDPGAFAGALRAGRMGAGDSGADAARAAAGVPDRRRDDGLLRGR